MLRTGILNPQILSLLARVRHTNTLVIADRGFPSWPGMEIVDLALTDDIPKVFDVLMALHANFIIGKAWMASEFLEHNPASLREEFQSILPTVVFEPHAELKQRVPQAVGLIRTAGTAPYTNVILESA